MSQPPILTGPRLVPRYYQEESIIGIFEYFYRGGVGNPVIALPTGTGKALVIAEFMRRALQYYPQTRIMCVTDVKELVAQNHAELLEIWPTAPAGIYSAGLNRRDTHHPILFCGIASIHRNIEYFGRIDLILVDEAHMISDKSSTMYGKAIAELKRVNPFLKVIGLTATPFRQGMGLLTDGKLFTDIIVDYCTLEKFNELLAHGYLAPLVPKRTQTELDVNNVAVHGGEFVQKDLQAAVDKEVITRAACEESVMLARDRKHWLVFCTGTDHADHTRDILAGLGISACCVHSKLPGGDSERDHNIKLFKSGMRQAMVGVGVFTKGFNFKPVDCIVVLRPTMSTALWVQLLGRGTRPSPETGKRDCLVLDFAANTRRLGPINDPVLPKKKGKKGPASVPYKICPACDTYNHTRVRFCVCCQAEFPQTFAATGQAATDELIAKDRPKVDKSSAPDPVPERQVVVDTFNIERVEYAKHFSRQQGKPPSLRVTYYCYGGRVVNEWLCLEHPGWPSKKARDTWRLMAGHGTEGYLTDDPPTTIDEALTKVDDLCPPSQIRCTRMTGDKHYEVCGYDFGTPGLALPTQRTRDDGADDDIPF